MAWPWRLLLVAVTLFAFTGRVRCLPAPGPAGENAAKPASGATGRTGGVRVRPSH